MEKSKPEFQFVRIERDETQEEIERKALAEAQRNFELAQRSGMIAALVFLLVGLCVVLAALALGVVIVLEGGENWGVGLLAFGAGLLIAGLVMGWLSDGAR